MGEPEINSSGAGEPLGAVDAKMRVRDWGFEAQAAHGDLMKRVNRLVPWALGGLGATVLAGMFVRRGRRKGRSGPAKRGEERADADGGMGAGLWPVILPLALRYGPSAISAFLKAMPRRGRGQSPKTD